MRSRRVQVPVQGAPGAYMNRRPMAVAEIPPGLHLPAPETEQGQQLCPRLALWGSQPTGAQQNKDTGGKGESGRGERQAWAVLLESPGWPCPFARGAGVAQFLRKQVDALSPGRYHLVGPWGPSPGPSPAALAGEATPATVAAAEAREAKAPGGDGHSLRAEDAANGSGGGGSHGGALREGAEDGSGQGHHHGGGLDDDGGVLALPDAGLIAAVGQRGRAAGLAGQARVVAGHVLGLEVHLGERAGRSTGACEEQPVRPPRGSQGTCWVGSWRLCRGAHAPLCLCPQAPCKESQAQESSFLDKSPRVPSSQTQALSTPDLLPASPPRSGSPKPRSRTELPTHLLPKEKKGSEADERVKSWGGFYSGPALPQVQGKPLWK